ncbi:MAG: HTTM domain-containing protein [Myxococcales bacterium]|nr:HTTM domain-containing protein [Myxococcales bacterium]
MRWLAERIDAAHLTVFRVLFGLILAVAPVRFAAYGWIEALYLEPTFHFAWTRFAVVPSAPVLYAMHGLMALCGVAIAAGRLYRPALAVYLGCFTYLELLDKTLYLNHYVLVTILLVTLLVAPWRPEHTRAARWVRELLRLELGLVWFWAGVCKLNPDWLLRGEPLHTWLRARMEIPVVGPWLALPETALVMSWAGAAFDLSIYALLLWPRTRVVGFVLLTGFHLITGLLFPIGVFPWVMIAGALLFLPDAAVARVSGRSALPPEPGSMRPATAVVMAGWVALLALFPARHWLEPGWVNWNERGFRLAWRVLLIEKTGQVDFRVVDRETRRRWTVSPATELTVLQHKQMRTQPDMILDYAHHLADRNAREGRDVEVYAESWASLNGRRTQRLVRPDVDLARTSYDDTGWIVPLQNDAPVASRR